MPPLIRDTELFLRIIQEIEDAQINYCVAHTSDTFPDEITSDVDMIVDTKDFNQLTSVLRNFGLIQRFNHGSEANLFVLSDMPQSNSIPFLQLDTYVDFRQFGYLVLTSADFLTGKRRVKDQFWAPSFEIEYIYYLIKRIGKESVNSVHINRLHELYCQEPVKCNDWIDRFFPTQMAEKIKFASQKVDWSNVNVKECKEIIVGNARKKHFFDYLVNRVADLIRRVKRIFKPTGLWVVFLGIDGCGKSSVIRTVLSDLALGFRRSKTFHFRPEWLWKSQAVSQDKINNPHQQTARGSLNSVVKLAALYLDWLLGYDLDLYQRLVQSTFILVDRYFYDILIDPVRYRVHPQVLGFAKFLSSLLPKPDLVFYLDVSAETANTRKVEMPLEELKELGSAYSAYFSKPRKNTVIINADQSLEDVVSQVESTILSHLKQRAVNQLHK